MLDKDAKIYYNSYCVEFSNGEYWFLRCNNKHELNNKMFIEYGDFTRFKPYPLLQILRYISQTKGK